MYMLLYCYHVPIPDDTRSFFAIVALISIMSFELFKIKGSFVINCSANYKMNNIVEENSLT